MSLYFSWRKWVFLSVFGCYIISNSSFNPTLKSSISSVTHPQSQVSFKVQKYDFFFLFLFTIPYPLLLYLYHHKWCVTYFKPTISYSWKVPFFFFLGLYPQHMEVPRLGVEYELCLRPTPQLMAMRDLLTHDARPGIKPESSWILVRFHWATMGTPVGKFLKATSCL